MPTDPTTAEKAERLGLVWLCGPDCWADAKTGATRISRDKPGGDWIHFEDWRSWDTDLAAIDALYAERFPEFTVGTGIHPNAPSLAPAPDYRAALEVLERIGTRLVEEWNNINVDSPRGFADVQASIEDMTVTLHHARKVLHGQ